MSNFRRFARGVRGSLGYDVSSDDEDTELNPATGIRRKRQARSPSPGAQARSNADRQAIIAERDLEEERRAAEKQLRRLQQEARENEHETNIDDMIRQINEQTLFGIPYVNLDPNNPDTRFAVGMVVRTHGMTEDSLRLLQRSPFLFRIFTDRIRNSRAARLLCAAGSTAVECARFSGHLLSTGLRSVASAASSRFRRAIRPSERQQQQQQQLAMDEMLALQSHQPGAEASSAVRVSRDQIAADELVARQFMRSSLHQRASAAGPAPEHSQPPPSPPPAPIPVAPQVEDVECSICMAGANYIDERGVNYGPLGYVETHRNGAIGHPNRFHRRCLQACPDNKCPMCRAVGPVWGLERPPGQGGGGGGGGGSRKPRSKSRSKPKSKSKTRRLRKSRNKSHNKPRKPRKSRRRIRSSSSRRK